MNLFANVMKRLFHFLTIIAMTLICCSCADPISTPSLREAEKLAEMYPDSAMAILKKINPDDLRNDDERMLHRLLLIEVKDVSYISSPDTTEINSILEYFIGQNRLRRIHPLALYYAGRAFSDERDYAKALTYFKKSLRKIPKEGDLFLERRIHSQISGIYQITGISRHFLREAKIYSALSDSIASLDPSYLNRHDELAARITLATAYRILGITDTALNIYTSLEPQVKALNDSILTSGFYVSWARLYLKQNMTSKADSLVKQLDIKYDRSSRGFISIALAEIENSKSSPNINEEEMKELLKTDDITDKYFAARNLAEIADRKNNGHDLLIYSRMAHRLSYKLQKAVNDAALVEMEKIIDEAETESENTQLRAQRQHDQVTIMWLGLGMALVILVAVVFFFRARMRGIKLSVEFEKVKESNRNRILLLESEIRNLRNNAMPEERIQRIVDMEDNLNLAKVSEEIATRIMSSDNKPDEELFARLRAALALTNPSLIAALDGMGLKAREYQDTMLMKIRIPQKICGDFFSITPQAVANLRRRLFKKFGSHSEFKNWKDYIDSM